MATVDTHQIRLSEAKKYIAHASVKRKRPVMLWGPPGVGKSEVVESIVTDAQAAGKTAKLYDMRLSMCEPTDIMGIPFFNSESTTMAWAPPSLLPKASDAEDYDLVILFLDELNGAAPAVQAAAYQLILNRRVGEYELPDNVAVVAAGNRETDKGVTYRMPKPLANRFIHFEVKVHFEDWQEWAISNGVIADVVGYLTAKKNDLFKFDPKSPDHSFPTPRSWTFVSEILQDSDGFTEGELTDMIIGTIGQGTALSFAAHRKTAALLPDPTLILKGKVTELKTKEISAMFSLATSLAYELKAFNEEIGRSIEQDEMNQYINNAIGFWMEHFEPEMIVMSFRMLAKYGIKIAFKELSNWQVFYKRYGDLVVSA